MERPSLNSTRNFKLPPIQSAAMADPNFKETSWITRYPSPVKSNRIAKPKETFIQRPKTNVNSRLVTAPKRTCDEVESRGASTATTNTRMDFDFGHNLPRPYAVLPPIKSENRIQQQLIYHGKSARRGKDSERSSFRKSQTTEVRSNRDSHRETTTQHSENYPHTNFKRSEKQSRKFLSENSNDSIYQDGFAEENEESNNFKERKRSATYSLFMKGTRKGRRCGVCLQNEQTLINVCELLKEIFLRRNMEEMYLI